VVRTQGRQPTPTPSEAEHAAYIDFEGTETDPPSLLGILFSDGATLHFEQHVIEEALWPAADAKAVELNGHCRRSDPAKLAARLRELAQEGRTLIAYSTREEQALREFPPPDSEIAASVVNALPWVRRWIRREYPNEEFERTPASGKYPLRKVVALIGYQFPPHLGTRKQAGRIRHVRSQLASNGGSYARITPVAKAKWTKLLEKNWHDCRALRELIVRIAADSASRPGDPK
jgi:hypothetical protein